MSYTEKLKDGRWQKKRLEIMDRDIFKCVDTGKNDNLQIHHCWYAKGNPWDTPSEYLITVSEEAHQERHIVEGEIRKHMGRIFAGCKIEDLRAMWKQTKRIAEKLDESQSFGSEDGPYFLEQAEVERAFFDGHILPKPSRSPETRHVSDIFSELGISEFGGNA